ncbi:hypothetical protein ISCGN_018647 [Ixodes scapularis]
MLGLFVENGPYLVDKGGNLQLRKVTWARRYSMLYVDNPVGVGFSFTQQDRGYAHNESDVGRDLFEALQQFFTLFPEYVGNDFYATGESYAGYGRYGFGLVCRVCGWLRRREGPRKDAELAEYESRPTIRATGRLPLSTGDAVSAAWCHDRFVAVHVDSKLEVMQFRSGTSRTTFSGASHVEAFRRIQ